jgi:copper chaperone CopZ
MNRLTHFALATIIALISLGCEAKPPSREQAKIGDRLVLLVSGMTCSGCEGAVNQGVMTCPMVNAVEASATDEEVVLWVKPGSDLSTVKAKINSLGFAVEPDATN